MRTDPPAGYPVDGAPGRPVGAREVRNLRAERSDPPKIDRSDHVMTVQHVLNQHPSNLLTRYAHRSQHSRPAPRRFLPRLTGTDRETVIGFLVAIVGAGALTIATRLAEMIN